jgi:hypothetical protein
MHARNVATAWIKRWVWDFKHRNATTNLEGSPQDMVDLLIPQQCANGVFVRIHHRDRHDECIRQLGRYERTGCIYVLKGLRP